MMVNNTWQSVQIMLSLGIDSDSIPKELQSQYNELNKAIAKAMIDINDILINNIDLPKIKEITDNAVKIDRQFAEKLSEYYKLAPKKKQTIQERYIAVVTEYIALFCEKHDVELSYWVSDEVGRTACFNDYYYINFSDIKYDIDTEQPASLILAWHDSDEFIHAEVNFNSYSKGLRIEHIIGKNDNNNDHEYNDFA